MLTKYSHDRHNNKKIIYTTTNEPFMPVRLYYKIHNEYLLIKLLRKLKCIAFEDSKHFILSYFKEAKNLDLEVYYQDVPENLYPVLLAEGHIKPGAILHLDLKSLQRAVLVIDFLAKYIPPTIIEITHFANANKLTISNNKQELEKIITLNYDQFFSESRIHHTEVDIDMELNEDARNIDCDIKYHDFLDIIEQKWDIVESRIREQELKSFHAVEKVKINYDKRKPADLIKWLTFRTFIKEIIASEHTKDNINYSSTDII
jgi:hypothetical protein